MKAEFWRKIKRSGRQITAALAAFLLLARPAIAAPWEDRCQEQGVPTMVGIECLLERVFRIILPVAGLAVGIMVIAAGFQLITAGSEKEGMAKAKATLTYAFLGLVFIFIAWFVLKFIEYLTGANLSFFSLSPGSRI